MPLPALLASPVAASAASGLLNGLGSIFGSNKSYQAAKLANATNLQIARETNQANLDLAEKNNAFNRGMYEKQNEDQIKFWQLQNQYNDPSNEVARLRKAGINPSMAFGDGAAAGAIQSATAPIADQSGLQDPGFVSPEVPGTSLAEAGGLALQKAIETYKSVEEARMASIDREFARANILADLENKKADLKKKGQESSVLDDTLKLLAATFKDRSESPMLQNSFLRGQINKVNEEVTSIELDRQIKKDTFLLAQRAQEFQESKFQKEYSALIKRLEIEAQNAQTAAYNAKTGRMNYGLAKAQFIKASGQAWRDYQLKVRQQAYNEKRGDELINLSKEQFEWNKKHLFDKLAGTVANSILDKFGGVPAMIGHGATAGW